VAAVVAVAAAPGWLQDEELGRYRQRMQSLSAYCTANNLPKVCLTTFCAPSCWAVAWTTCCLSHPVYKCTMSFVCCFQRVLGCLDTPYTP
jgi:hypothetical protein